MHLILQLSHNNRQTFRELFFQLHVKDQMESFHALYTKNKQKIEEFLTPVEFAKLFAWMSLEEQRELYEIFSSIYISQLLSHMEVDNVVRFLNDLSDVDTRILLDLFATDKRLMIEKLLAREPETAGSVMTKSY